MSDIHDNQKMTISGFTLNRNKTISRHALPCDSNRPVPTVGRRV